MRRASLFFLLLAILLLGSPQRILAAPAKPVGWKPLASAAAARLVRNSPWEPRPGNRAANQTMPGPEELAAWRATSTMPYASLVDGHFTGTTDEIIQ